MITRVVDLLAVHHTIDQALHEVCLAVVAGDLAGEAAWRGYLNGVLGWHLGGEDRVLLPVYAALDIERPPFGDPAIIAEEHRRIEGLLSQAAAGPALDRLSALRRLAHLLEHHDQREAKSFKPLLDEALPPAERARLLKDAWAGRPDAPPPSPVRGAGTAAGDPTWRREADPDAAVSAAFEALGATRAAVAQGGLTVGALVEALRHGLVRVEALAADNPRFRKLRGALHPKLAEWAARLEREAARAATTTGRERLEAAVALFDALGSLESLALAWERAVTGRTTRT